jgi:sensor histidine kinase regulating citrate/malate metabolism
VVLPPPDGEQGEALVRSLLKTDGDRRTYEMTMVTAGGERITCENHVFDRGYSTSDDGTGFGLRIVEECAEDHGWSVRLIEGECGGARFEFTGVAPVDD